MWLWRVPSDARESVDPPASEGPWSGSSAPAANELNTSSGDTAGACPARLRLSPIRASNSASGKAARSAGGGTTGSVLGASDDSVAATVAEGSVTGAAGSATVTGCVEGDAPSPVSEPESEPGSEPDPVRTESDGAGAASSIGRSDCNDGRTSRTVGALVGAVSMEKVEALVGTSSSVAVSGSDTGSTLDASDSFAASTADCLVPRWTVLLRVTPVVGSSPESSRPLPTRLSGRRTVP